MKHKHYDLILAWANGAKIEYRDITAGIDDWELSKSPRWYDSREYRIAEEPEVICSITHSDYSVRYYPQPIQSVENVLKLLPEVTSELFYTDVTNVNMFGWISRQDNPDFVRDLKRYVSKGILHKTRDNAVKHTYALLNLEYPDKV